MENELQQLGLSKDESRVYLAVLEAGQTTVGPIIKATRMHRQSVYDTLAKLKTEGLVFESVKANRKNFTAENPTTLLENIRNKEMIAERLLPELLAIRKESQEHREVRLFEGREGFIAHQRANLEAQPINSEMYVLGASAALWIKQMRQGKLYNNFEKMRMDKNVRFKLLFFEKERRKTNELFKRYYLKQPKNKRRKFKFLPDNYSSPVAIQIWHDNVSLIVYSDSPLIIQIKGQALVESFSKYFSHLWQTAKT